MILEIGSPRTTSSHITTLETSHELVQTDIHYESEQKRKP
jgi:hypothetical protein